MDNIPIDFGAYKPLLAVFSVLLTMFLILYYLTKTSLKNETMERQILTQDEMISFVKSKNPKHYKKFGSFTFEVADKAQLVETFIAGKKEVEKYIQEGDIILTGPEGERYGTDFETFNKRYDIKQVSTDGSTGVAVTKGEAWGIIYEGEPFTFISPWKDGEGKETTMICEPGDTLVSPDPEFTKVYRIEKGAFVKTYTEA